MKKTIVSTAIKSVNNEIKKLAAAFADSMYMNDDILVKLRKRARQSQCFTDYLNQMVASKLQATVATLVNLMSQWKQGFVITGDDVFYPVISSTSISHIIKYTASPNINDRDVSGYAGDRGTGINKNAIINKEDIPYYILTVTGLSTNFDAEIRALKKVNGDVSIAQALQTRCESINEQIITALTSIDGIAFHTFNDKRKGKNDKYRERYLNFTVDSEVVDITKLVDALPGFVSYKYEAKRCGQLNGRLGASIYAHWAMKTKEINVA